MLCVQSVNFLINLDNKIYNRAKNHFVVRQDDFKLFLRV